MNILKQSTAATIKLGPFIDDTDGKTAETGLTIAQADIRLSKNGGDFAQTNNTAGATHDENGYYDIPLNATDTGTLGRLRVAVSKSGALPVWQDFLVVTANVYDTLCSTDSLDVNVTALADDIITAAKFDESTAFPLKSADTGSTAVARVGADGDTLETLSDQLDTKASEATLTAIKGAGWTDETLVALMEAIEDISTGSGATPQQIWEYVSRTLTDASGLGLATSEELAEAVADIQGTQGDTLQTITYKINTIDAVVDTIYAEMGSAPEIADAVLDELLDDHTIDGSLGDTVADIAAKTNNLPDNPALDEVLIDTGTQQFTTADLIKIIAAKMVGKASGGGTTSIVYRNLEDSVDIIVETVDENGNRSDITLAP